MNVNDLKWNKGRLGTAASRYVRLLVASVALWAGFQMAALAQTTTVSTDQILAAVAQDASVMAQQNTANFQRQAVTDLPLIDEIAVRTQTRRSDIYQQDYQLRAGMNGTKERRAYRQVQAAELGVTEAAQVEQHYELLFERYQKMAEYKAVAAELVLQRQLLQVYLDKVQLFENAAQALDPDPEQLMKSEFDRDDVQARIKENEGRLHRIMGELTGNPEQQLDTALWATPQVLAQHMLLLTDTAQGHPLLAELEAKAARSDQEIGLEKARGAQVLDFFQLRYTNRPGEPFRNDFSVGAGFTLPYNGSRKARAQVLSVEQFAANEALKAAAAAMKSEVEKAKLAFLYDQKNIQTHQEQVQKLAQRYNLGAVASTDRDGIETVLLYQEFALRRLLKLREHEAALWEHFLEGVYYSGKLGQKNWLKT